MEMSFDCCLCEENGFCPQGQQALNLIHRLKWRIMKMDDVYLEQDAFLVELLVNDEKFLQSHEKVLQKLMHMVIMGSGCDLSPKLHSMLLNTALVLNKLKSPHAAASKQMIVVAGYRFIFSEKNQHRKDLISLETINHMKALLLSVEHHDFHSETNHRRSCLHILTSLTSCIEFICIRYKSYQRHLLSFSLLEHVVTVFRTAHVDWNCKVKIWCVKMMRLFLQFNKETKFSSRLVYFLWINNVQELLFQFLSKHQEFDDIRNCEYILVFLEVYKPIKT